MYMLSMLFVAISLSFPLLRTYIIMHSNNNEFKVCNVIMSFMHCTNEPLLLSRDGDSTQAMVSKSKSLLFQ